MEAREIKPGNDLATNRVFCHEEAIMHEKIAKIIGLSILIGSAGGTGVVVGDPQASSTDSPTVGVLWPVAPADLPTAGLVGDAVAEEPTEDFVVRTGVVSFNTSAFDNNISAALTQATKPNAQSRQEAAVEPGKMLRLAFFPDAQFDFEIASQQVPASDIFTLGGRLPGDELATFTLTLTPNSYLITFTDIATNQVYRVVGNTATGYGQVTQIDQSSMPPVIHQEPLVGPLP